MPITPYWKKRISDSAVDWILDKFWAALGAIIIAVIGVLYFFIERIQSQWVVFFIGALCASLIIFMVSAVTKMLVQKSGQDQGSSSKNVAPESIFERYRRYNGLGDTLLAILSDWRQSPATIENPIKAMSRRMGEIFADNSPNDVARWNHNAMVEKSYMAHRAKIIRYLREVLKDGVNISSVAFALDLSHEWTYASMDRVATFLGSVAPPHSF